MEYNTVVAGTFDYFHAGHKNMIEKAMSISNSIVGITSDELANKGREREVHSFQKRKVNVKQYCEEMKDKYGTNYKIIKVNDPKGEGSGIMSEEMENIVVSPENKTIERVNQINDMRVAEGLKPLSIKVVEPVYAEDGSRISSTRISKGIIDRSGSITNNKNNFLVINDIHYGFFEEEKENNKILENLEEVLTESNCKDVLVLGDLIHDDWKNPYEEFEKAWSIIEENTNRCYFTPGNHDVIQLSKNQIEDIVGHKIPIKINLKGNSIYIWLIVQHLQKMKI